MSLEAGAVEIRAPAALVYDLLADVTRMGEWSPECEACWGIGGADHAVVGARFRGRSRNGRRRWTTTATITAARPGECFSFDVTYFGRPVASWTYDLRPIDESTTLLTETAVDKRRAVLRRISPVITGSSDRGERNDATIHETLARLKHAAEAGG